MIGLVLVSAVVLVYALSSTLLDRASITGPLVLVVVGAALGTGGIDVLHVSVGTEALKALAEVALAIILFSDASSLSVSRARRQIGPTGRLLGAGLPLTMALGAAVCHLLFPQVSWATCALAGCVLAPTDAALGLAVVTNPAVPQRVRETLSIEGGLNDGLATPFVYFFLAVVLSEDTHGHWTHALVELVGGIGVGAGLGLAVGWCCAWACRRWEVADRSRQLAVLAAGLLCFVTALALGCNGFVAAYVAGFAFAIGSRGALANAKELSDEAGIYTSFAVWLLFGATVVGPVFHRGISWTAVAYACLSLTIIRMLPVAISLVGTKNRPITTAFIGWFGPRGLASVVFLIVAIDSIPKSAGLQMLVEVSTWTILLSVVLHGLSSRPLATAFGRVMARAGDTPDDAQSVFIMSRHQRNLRP